MRGRGWLNSGLGIAAFALTVLSTLALLTDEPYFSNEVAVFGALAFGLVIILIAALYRPKHSLSELRPSKVIQASRKAARNAQEVVVVNPVQSGGFVSAVIKHATEVGLPISVLGDAELVHNLMSHAVSEMEEEFFSSTRILNAPSDECIVCFLDKNETGIRVFFLAREYHYLFRLRDSFVASLIMDILKKEGAFAEGSIGLNQVANPKKLISVVQEEQKRYLRNFQTLQKGYISFYGTEVQSVQSGWVESGDFSSIDTLDMTTNPSRLLHRHRYNAANERFIEQGGRIRRVYMVQADALAEPAFKNDMQKLYDQQVSIGVDIGIVMLEDLPQRLRKDFILYDDAIALVEDQQASADYQLGRSTAYFSVEEIRQHRTDFDSVWTGQITGREPLANAVAIFGEGSGP